MDERMTEEELQAIEARAEAATPGPWSREMYEDGEEGEGPHGVYPGSRGPIVAGPGVVRYPQTEDDFEIEIAEASKGVDAAHIAGMDPATTLRLLAALRAERARADAERAARKAEEDVWLGAIGQFKPDRKATHDALRAAGVSPVTAPKQEPPALPGEVWRGTSKDGEVVAVAVRDGEAWTYIWGPPEFGPFEWWGSVADRRQDTLAAWALAERARAERAEAIAKLERALRLAKQTGLTEWEVNNRREALRALGVEP